MKREPSRFPHDSSDADEWFEALKEDIPGVRGLWDDEREKIKEWLKHALASGYEACCADSRGAGYDE